MRSDREAHCEEISILLAGSHAVGYAGFRSGKFRIDEAF